ncbi:MAG: ATP-binding protein [Sandaracinaceae bacterium]
MTSLRARLVVFGALLPTLILAASLVLVGLVFERILLSGVDEAMRTQAAVEAVSLFDSPDGRPHVHLGRSPLGEEVGDLVSAIAVYDASGARVAEHPEGYAGFPERFDPASIRRDAPHDARDARGAEIRLHTVRVRGPDGRPYAVWLGHDLAHHTAVLAAYRQSGTAVVGLVALVLFALQLAHASRLHRRLGALVAHMERLREGDLDAALPEDRGTDELGVLRAAIADATEKLRAARRGQERLVSDAAHELRTPLATMKAAIEVTLRRERSAPELRETLEHVREEVDRLTSLSSALLDLASLRAREPERVDFDLVETARKAVAGARGAAESSEVSLAVELPDTLGVRGSPREVRQALDNLLANALAHTPARSTITLSIERRGAKARVVVRDAGSGIAPSERELVFEPFHRGASRDPAKHPRGQGLGLAIVRDVAVRHGGAAYVVDEPGPGAAIAFELAL